jgi:hypothetical protein
MAWGIWREGETDFLSSESLDGSNRQPSDTLLAIRVWDQHIRIRQYCQTNNISNTN